MPLNLDIQSAECLSVNQEPGCYQLIHKNSGFQGVVSLACCNYLKHVERGYHYMPRSDFMKPRVEPKCTHTTDVIFEHN